MAHGHTVRYGQPRRVAAALSSRLAYELGVLGKHFGKCNPPPTRIKCKAIDRSRKEDECELTPKQEQPDLIPNPNIEEVSRRYPSPKLVIPAS